MGFEDERGTKEKSERTGNANVVDNSCWRKYLNTIKNQSSVYVIKLNKVHSFKIIAD